MLSHRRSAKILRRSLREVYQRRCAQAAAATWVETTPPGVFEEDFDGDVLANITSDRDTRSGLQPWNMEIKDKVRAFEPWSWEDSPSPMVLPVYWHPASPGLNLENCLVDCAKLRPGGADLKTLCTGDTVDTNNKLAEDLQARMEDTFGAWGACILRNTQLTDGGSRGDAAKMEQLSNMLLKQGPSDYTGGSNLRGSLDTDTNVYDTGAPRGAHLHYHHEMQYVNRSPKTISFLALAVPHSPQTGPTYISYNPNVTRDLLETECGRKLAEKGACYVRKLPDLSHFQATDMDPRIVYNFWQTSMDTDDPDAAAAIARSQGLEVEWEESPVFGRYMVTRFYIDAFEYDPRLDKNQLFCSVADDWMWFDTWQGLADVAPQHRPLALEYGDDSQLTPAEKRTLADVYDNHGVPITWDRPGDMVLICNWRTAHGRPAYDLQPDEERELGVILGARFNRMGQKEGKW